MNQNKRTYFDEEESVGGEYKRHCTEDVKHNSVEHNEEDARELIRLRWLNDEREAQRHAAAEAPKCVFSIKDKLPEAMKVRAKVCSLTRTDISLADTSEEALQKLLDDYYPEIQKVVMQEVGLKGTGTYEFTVYYLTQQ